MITFILGVSAAIVVGTMVWLTVSMINTLKWVKSITEEKTHIWSEIENRCNSIDRERYEIQRLTDQRIDTTISYIDSRFDKFNNHIERSYVSKIDNASNTISYNN